MAVYIIKPWHTPSFFPLSQHVCCLTVPDKNRQDADGPVETREHGQNVSFVGQMHVPAVLAAYSTADEPGSFSRCTATKHVNAAHLPHSLL